MSRAFVLVEFEHGAELNNRDSGIVGKAVKLTTWMDENPGNALTIPKLNGKICSNWTIFLVQGLTYLLLICLICLCAEGLGCCRKEARVWVAYCRKEVRRGLRIAKCRKLNKNEFWSLNKS